MAAVINFNVSKLSLVFRYIGFQTNERTLEWEESAGIQMIKLYICQKTGKAGLAC